MTWAAAPWAELPWAGALATGPVSYSLSLDAGSYNLTGQALDLKSARSIATGSYTLTGYSVDLTYFDRIIATGSYTLTGYSVDLRYFDPSQFTLHVGNNATSTVPTGILSTDTTITVAAGTGSRFPVLAVDEYFYATISDSNNYFEIVRVTGRSGDTMTVIRGQEGTLPIPFSPNARFDIFVTVENILSRFLDIDYLLF